MCVCEFPPRCKLNKGEEMPIEDTKQGKVAQYLQVGCLSKKEGVFKWGDGEGELIKSLFGPTGHGHIYLQL